MGFGGGGEREGKQGGRKEEEKGRKKLPLFSHLSHHKKKKKIKNRRPLDVGPYLKHLAGKYGPLYDLPQGRAEELVAPGMKLAAEALERARKR